MSMLLEITEEWHDGVPVLRLDGEIDVANVEEIRSRIRALVTNQVLALVVDLSPTSYLDSAGINLLFATGEEMRGRQQQLYVVLPDASPVVRMVRLTGLDQALPTFGGLDEALEAASARR